MEIQKTNIDEKGNIQQYMTATPIGMICEHPECKNTFGRDYIRNDKKNDGWDEEPIFLCEQHSEGYTLL